MVCTVNTAVIAVGANVYPTPVHASVGLGGAGDTAEIRVPRGRGASTVRISVCVRMARHVTRSLGSVYVPMAGTAASVMKFVPRDGTGPSVCRCVSVRMMRGVILTTVCVPVRQDGRERSVTEHALLDSMVPIVS